MNRELEKAFTECGYESGNAKVQVSNRPDLCEFQCNGCMAAAKAARKKPIYIAGEVSEVLKKGNLFSEVTAAMPGFINLKLSPEALNGFLKEMGTADHYGAATENPPRTVFVDYGGANVAKPLHIGHLRSAIIGESIKRMGAYAGNKMIGDVHLGDWGLQMGLIIEELKLRKPELPYFDPDFQGEYPEEAPFTISELEEIYPTASKRAKEDVSFAEKAHEATLKLQEGYKPYHALWQHILNVSRKDLKKNYDALDVNFELWKGESDAEPYIPALIKDLTDKKLAYESEGALVVDVAEEGDSREYPPCIVRKSDGAALYATSDLATLVEREKLYHPDEYIYITDKRQDLHFIQVFRVAAKAGIVPPERKMVHIGFGTMNGKDGKPFKTREGGVMRLEDLIREVREAVYTKISENPEIPEEEARETSRIVGLAALKYGDLSNQAAKDYVFDLDRFASFEGNTGPYILYTIVRIKSILKKYMQAGGKEVGPEDLKSPCTEPEKALFLSIAGYPDVIPDAWKELAPYRICQYVYAVAEAFNSFYHEVKILSETDEEKKRSYLYLILLTKNILSDCMEMLGMEIPDRM